MGRKTNHGLNLLRIISMLGIIGLHVLNAGGGMDRENLLSPGNAVLSYFYILCACSVDTFAMITGFLYEGRTSVRYRNLLNLLATVFFYCGVITCFFWFFDKSLFEHIQVATSLYPFRENRFWYIACYVLLFVLIPYINILLNNLNDRQLDILAMLLFVVTSVLPVTQKLDFFRMEWGYSSAWLIVCYILGAYAKRRQWRFPLRHYIALAAAVSVAIFGYSALCFHYEGNAAAFGWATEYVSPGIVLLSFLLVSIFSKVNPGNSNRVKVIAQISGAAFDVYILHSHIVIFSISITDCFYFLQTMEWYWIIPVFAGVLGAIYVIGLFSWKIRTSLFHLTKLDVLLEKLGSILDKHLFTSAKEGKET